MKRAMLLAVLALALPVTAMADGIDLTNQFGTVNITTNGIVTAGSELTSYNGIVAAPNHSLGTVSFSTGALTSGTILGGGTFSSTGSSFDVVGNGSMGVPKGAIFTGAFVGPITWTLLSFNGKQTYTFDLSGTIVGTLYNGRTVTGFTNQYITVYKNQYVHDHVGGITHGNTGIATPEPGSLGLMGTGLLALGLARKKLFV